MVVVVVTINGAKTKKLRKRNLIRKGEYDNQKKRKMLINKSFDLRNEI